MIFPRNVLKEKVVEIICFGRLIYRSILKSEILCGIIVMKIPSFSIAVW